MKLKTLFVAIAAMSLMLVGCDKGGSKSTPPKTEWTEADLALMHEHLYEEDLPYYEDAGNITVMYDTQYKSVNFFGDKTISILDVFGWIDANFTEEKGWEQIVTFNEGAYTYEKSLVGLPGCEETRYVCVCIGVLNADDEYDITGTFYMYALDPYTYHYPSKSAQAFAESFGSTFVVPEYGNNRFIVYADDLCIFAYDLESDITTSFAETLSGLSWDVFPPEVVDDYGYRIANSPDGKYCVLFKFYDDDYSFGVYFEEPFMKTWEGAMSAAQAIFSKEDYAQYNPQFFTIPELSGVYRVVENEYGKAALEEFDYPNLLAADIKCYAQSQSTLTSYVQTLIADSWDLEEDVDEDLGETYYYGAKETDGDYYYLDLTFDGDSLITITMYLLQD